MANGARLSFAFHVPISPSAHAAAITLHESSFFTRQRGLSVNGAVRLEIPSTLDVDLDATTVNGGVSVDERLGLANVSSNRGGFGPTTNISGRLNKGGPHVTLQTTNGGIRVAPRGSGDADEEPGRPGRRGRRGPTPAEF